MSALELPRELDVVQFTVAELAEAGVELTGYAGDPPRKSAPVWKSHTHLLTAIRPEWDRVDRSQARRAAIAHFAEHETLAGLKLLRSFPCLGNLRVTEDDDRRPPVVVCDVCRFECAVTRNTDPNEAGW